MSASVAQLAAQLVDLVTEPGGVLETQISGRLVHLFFERLDEPSELRGCEVTELVAPPFVPRALQTAAPVASGCRCLPVAVRPEVSEDVGDGLADRLRVDPPLGVVLLLQTATSVRLRDRSLHRVGH